MSDRSINIALIAILSVAMAALLATSLATSVDAVAIALFFAAGALVLRLTAELAVRVHHHRHR